MKNIGLAEALYITNRFLYIENFLASIKNFQKRSFASLTQREIKDLSKRVKIAHSFSQSESNQFHFIILSLSM